MRNDGLTTMGAIEHYCQTPWALILMTVLRCRFCRRYVHYRARSAIESFLSIYNDMRNIQREGSQKISRPQVQQLWPPE